MFYHVTLSQNIDLEPRHFGARIRETIRNKLVEKVEGSCGKHGYIICVTAMNEISQGKIRQDGSGLATYKVQYECVALRPFKEEVVDMVVDSVSKMGFFGKVGPMQVFVSNHLIPEEYEYNSSGEAAYVSADASVRIEENVVVRVRVVGVRITAAEVFCICSMKDEYCGVVDAMEEH